jgi:hypothetical protein
MGWVRGYRRYGVWPGLAALALQLVLSFGHIHVGNVHIGSVHLGNVLFGSGAGASGVTAANSPHLAQAPQKAPAQNSGDDDDYCAICASIFLASTSFVAEPPQLPVPLGFERIALTFDADQGVSTPRRAAFQSRAPPAASSGRC